MPWSSAKYVLWQESWLLKTNLIPNEACTRVIKRCLTESYAFRKPPWTCLDIRNVNASVSISLVDWRFITNPNDGSWRPYHHFLLEVTTNSLWIEPDQRFNVNPRILTEQHMRTGEKIYYLPAEHVKFEKCLGTFICWSLMAVTFEIQSINLSIFTIDYLGDYNKFSYPFTFDQKEFFIARNCKNKETIKTQAHQHCSTVYSYTQQEWHWCLLINPSTLSAQASDSVQNTVRFQKEILSTNVINKDH